MNDSSHCVRVVISGRVQGVFFRDTCRREAHRHDVRGWVRNRPDGSVEAVFDGSPAGVRAMLDWARVGPPAARVDTVEVVDEPAESTRGLTGFEVRGHG